MHLLNTTTKQLKSFYGNNIPKYAILSHMWGREEDEVLFNHIAGSDSDRRKGKKRRGYAKIVGACVQALKDGWEYIWIDTCCINKESSAELSEAINSMYSWYKKSEVCYVYLEDVQSDGNVQNNKNTAFEIVPFERSRWFSRGWTLQELIAPQYVVFYSKDWTDIGTKASLQDTISAVTRIRAEMLIRYDPKKASVAERMSWAAFRETTREEDIAYCLMGLFDVNMPLLYGEGNRAFRRLQEEIMKVSDDHSLFAWKTRFNGRRNVNKGLGMLAGSPWNFRDGIDVLRSDNLNGAYSPYSMTNQGLQIKLPLLPIDPKHDLIDINPGLSKSVFKAVLKCTHRGEKPSRWIVIYLKITREGYYTRVFPHWLDETQINPNEKHINELTSLLVPQVDAFTSQDDSTTRQIEIKILPTASGFTVNGHNLVDGLEYLDTQCKDTQVISFDHQEKCFGVGIGLDNNVPWLDVIDVIQKGEQEIAKYASTICQLVNPRLRHVYRSYNEGGSRHSATLRHLDRLSVKIMGDWSVAVSVKKIGRSQNSSCTQAIIDIQKLSKQAKSSYISSPTIDNYGDDFPGGFDYHNVRPEFKKERSDWFAIFNPKVKRVLDVNLVHNFTHKSMVSCVRFSSDGKYLATGYYRATRIYETNTGTEKCILVDKNKTPRIHSLCFSSDSRLLVTGADDAQIRFWDIGKGRICKVLDGHQSTIYSLCFSPDGRLVISGSEDGVIRIWEIANGTAKVLTMDAPKSFDNVVGALPVAISPNGRFIAAGNSNGTIRIWDIITTQLLEELHGNSVCSVIFAQNGKDLVIGRSNGTLDYLDIGVLVPADTKGKTEVPFINGPRSSGTPIRKNTAKSSRRTISSMGSKDCVLSVAVSHDGHWVISGSDDSSVQFWDLRNTTAQFMLLGHMDSVCSVDMSPVGNVFATGSEDGRVRIWRYDTNI